MSDDNGAQAEAEKLAAIVTELIAGMATCEHVERRLSALDALWRDAQSTHTREEELSHRTWVVGRDRLTRLVAVSAQLASAADRVDDSAARDAECVDRAARLIALCEAKVTR